PFLATVCFIATGRPGKRGVSQKTCLSINIIHSFRGLKLECETRCLFPFFSFLYAVGLNSQQHEKKLCFCCCRPGACATCAAEYSCARPGHHPGAERCGGNRHTITKKIIGDRPRGYHHFG